MAFKSITVRLPEAYIKYIKEMASADPDKDRARESEGFIVQQAVYSMGNGKLPLPARRDYGSTNEEDA